MTDTAPEPTYYDILGIGRDASETDVKRAARRLMRENHPDHGGDPLVAARINEAAEILANPKARADYDTLLDRGPEEPVSTVPDPETFEDSWGAEEQWDEETIDAPTDETPGQDATDSPGPSPTRNGGQKLTKVRTLSTATILYLWLPCLVLVAVLAIRHGETTAPIAGLLLGVVAGMIIHQKFSRKPMSTYGLWIGDALLLILVVLTIAHPGSVSAIDTGLVTGIVTLFATWAGAGRAKAHRHNEQIIKSKALKQDGTIFGPGSPEPLAERLQQALWQIMAHPSFRAARGFQNNDPRKTFQKALLLGKKVVFIRPVYIDARGMTQPQAYWSGHNMFVTDRANPNGFPIQVGEFDTGPTTASARQHLGKTQVQYVAVVYHHGQVPVGLPEQESPGGVRAVAHYELESVVRSMMDQGKPVDWVGHWSAVGVAEVLV